MDTISVVSPGKCLDYTTGSLYLHMFPGLLCMSYKLPVVLPVLESNLNIPFLPPIISVVLFLSVPVFKSKGSLNRPSLTPKTHTFS